MERLDKNGGKTEEMRTHWGDHLLSFFYESQGQRPRAWAYRHVIFGTEIFREFCLRRDTKAGKMGKEPEIQEHCVRRVSSWGSIFWRHV